MSIIGIGQINQSDIPSTAYVHGGTVNALQQTMTNALNIKYKSDVTVQFIKPDGLQIYFNDMNVVSHIISNWPVITSEKTGQSVKITINGDFAEYLFNFKYGAHNIYRALYHNINKQPRSNTIFNPLGIQLTINSYIINYQPINIPVKPTLSMKPNSNNTSGDLEQNLNNIEAAGIIPYYIDSLNKCYFLLGYDPHDKCWKYFGGGKENEDHTTRNVAYREMIEETCQEYGSFCYLDFALQNIRNDLQNGNTLCIPKLNQLTGKWNNFYFIKIDINQWLLKHNNKYDIPVTGIMRNEVNRIKWFSTDEFTEIIKNNLNDAKQTKWLFSEGKIHPPIFAIFRDHMICQALKSLEPSIPFAILEILHKIQSVYDKEHILKN